jgi:histone H3/H4
MAAKKKTNAPKKAAGDLIISKSRTKAAAKKCNVSSDFYAALDDQVRAIINKAEQRATENKRKTLKPCDI